MEVHRWEGTDAILLTVKWLRPSSFFFFSQIMAVVNRILVISMFWSSYLV